MKEGNYNERRMAPRASVPGDLVCSENGQRDGKWPTMRICPAFGECWANCHASKWLAPLL